MSEKVIGGEFTILTSTLRGPIRNDLPSRYSLGRTCLYAILEAVRDDIDEVILPDYLCYSVSEVPMRMMIPFSHYHIGPDLLPQMDRLSDALSGKRCAVVLISYFGVIDLKDTVSAVRSLNPNAVVIVDDVQDLYSFGKDPDYDYCFTSYRKWLSVPDGADVIARTGRKETGSFQDEPKYVSYKTSGNLLKNFPGMMDESVFLHLLKKGEKMMDEDYLYKASTTGVSLLSKIDIDEVKERRKRNAKVLCDGLAKLGIPYIYNAEKTPLFVPIFVNDRKKLRSHLFSRNIFAPVHWPVENRKAQGENELYDTELSLIVDQRYDESDMERILREIKDGI